MPFIPHTNEDIALMLETLGVDSINALFNEIPNNLKIHELKLAEGLSEMEMTQLMHKMAQLQTRKKCFIGAGAYEHYIPHAVGQITGRGEFLTAYTPYQAEASQGTLQLLYEFQTMMANLMAMEVANASLYEGASGLAEAILMACRLQKNRRKIAIPKNVHPHYRQVVKTIVTKQNIEIIEIDYEPKTGLVPNEFLQKILSDEFAAVVIQQPNFFGGIEDVDVLTDLTQQQQILLIAVVNPIAMALLKPPGEWGTRGADIVCGEGQPLGIPLAGGGPYFGFLCSRLEFVRQMPGRIVGRTIDSEGNTGFTLTLQAREQHIRRAKATSNICTNQGLLVTQATIYMSLMGAVGLQRIAAISHAQTKKLVEKLCTIPGINRRFDAPFFHECVLKFDKPLDQIIAALSSENILAGLPLKDFYADLNNDLLVCVTETKTKEDIEHYVRIIKNKITPAQPYKSYVIEDVEL